MTATTDPRGVVTIPAGWQRLARVALISDVGIAVGLFEVLGPGRAFVLACSVTVAVSVLLMVLPVVRGTQRLEIGPAGFTSYNAFGRIAQKRAWEDVEGHFQVVRIAWSDAIAYQLSAACKTRPAKKSFGMPHGYDEAILSLFQKPAVQVALLLNERKRDEIRSRTSP